MLRNNLTRGKISSRSYREIFGGEDFDGLQIIMMTGKREV